MIDILRKINGVETIIASVSNKNASHKQVIMGADEVSVGIVVSQFIDVKDGDYINHNGIVYTCNRDAEYTKSSDVNYQYNLLFEHPFYRLLDKLFTFPLTGSAVFTLTGKLVDFVDAVSWNMNYHVTNNPRGIDSGWTRGSVVDTDYLTLTFGSISCRDAITQIATAFNAEFFFSGSGKTINFVDHIENETGLIFVQGRGNGLYSVSQQNVDTKDTITRVYPVGGNQNVPNAYADEDGNLKLPELYLQNTSEYSRIVEKRVVFEDVFPHFVGDVESVAGTNNVELVCSDIDFDLNEIAVGSNARINFLTGSLMGISFQFQFDFATKKVTLIPQNDDTALVNDDGTTPQVPQALKKAVVGDKFNFTGVVMPVQYVNAAITKLREKGTTWLSFYSRKRVKFGLDIDYRWMRGKQRLNPGDLVTVQIPERGIDKQIRISDLTTNLYDGQLNATVSNYRDENWQKKVEGAISSLQTTVSGGGAGSGGVDILERYDERPASDRNVMSSLRSEKNFLRKDATDTAEERITFDKGAVVRDLATKDFVQDKFAGAGAGIYEDSQGNTVIEVDKLNVRKEAWFNEIVINQIRFQGGIVVYSAATLEVSGVADGGSYLQVYFDTKDGQLANQFAVDDQIRCQRFSGGNVIKYYMSRVTSTGTDYIRLSKTDIDGTLNVEVGDAIVQFGNRTNTARQSLIEVNVLDGGKQTFYQGVNSYSLTNKNYLELGRMLVDGQWKNMIRSYGGAYLGNRDLSSYIQYNETTGKIEIKASVEFLGVDGSYKTVDQAIGDIKIGGVNLIAGTKVANTQAAFANGVGYSFFAGLVAIANYGLVVGDYVTLSFDLANIPYGYLAGAAFVVEVNGSSIYVVGQTIYQSGQRATITYKLPAGTTRIAPYVALNHAAIGAITIDYSKLKFEKGNKATDWSPSTDDVQNQINESKALLADIASDGKLTPNDKQVSLREWTAIQKAYNSVYAQCSVLGLDDDESNPIYATMVARYNSLSAYINPLLVSMNVTSDIVSATFNTYFSNMYDAIEAQKAQISVTLNTQSRSLDFVKSAVENGSAEFQGGLGLMNLLFMKNLLDQVTGGMSGLDDDNVGFWTGGTYTQALADASKAFKSAMSAAALDKKDGSGHRAKGNLAWDIAGNVFVKGLLEVLSGGKIGNFDIVAGRISGKDNNGIERVSVGVDSIPVNPSLLTSIYITAYDYSEHDDITGVLQNSAETQQQTGFTHYVDHTFQIATATYIQFATGFAFDSFVTPESVISSNVTIDAQIYLNGVLKGTTSEQTAFWVNGAGTVTVRERLNITAMLQPQSSTGYSFVIAGYGWGKFQESTSKSAIGKNGLFSYWNSGKYFYFSEEFGGAARGAWDIPAGLGGASINGSGGVISVWGKITDSSKVVKSGSNYTITHNIGDTDYSLILTPISTNVPYFSSRAANTVVVTCAGGFDFVLIRTK